MVLRSKKNKKNEINKKKQKKYKNYGGLLYLIHDGKKYMFKFVKIISEKKTKKIRYNSLKNN